MGYCYRQKVVHQVRTLYEHVVVEIEPENDIPFANESVMWPRKVGLCYPVFQPRNVEDNILRKTDQLCQECANEEKEVEQLVFNKDRESLLEMRSRLAMELVWLKQAISSRQKVNTRLTSKVACLIIIF